MGLIRMKKTILKEYYTLRITSLYMTIRKLVSLLNAEPLWSQQRRKINMLEQRWVEKLWNTHSKIHNYKANLTGSKTSSTIIPKLNANLRINNQKICWTSKKEPLNKQNYKIAQNRTPPKINNTTLPLQFSITWNAKTKEISIISKVFLNWTLQCHMFKELGMQKWLHRVEGGALRYALVEQIWNTDRMKNSSCCPKKFAIKTPISNTTREYVMLHNTAWQGTCIRPQHQMTAHVLNSFIFYYSKNILTTK